MPRGARFCVMSVACAFAVATTPILVWLIQPGDPGDLQRGASLDSIAPLALSVGGMVAAMALPIAAAMCLIVFALTPVAARRLRLSRGTASALVALVVGSAAAGIAAAGWPNALTVMSAPFQVGAVAPLVGGVAMAVLAAPWATRIPGAKPAEPNER